MNALLAEARLGRYAVSYCESWNLESLQGVLEAAVQLESPIIAGFSGRFLRDPGREKSEDLRFYAGLRRAMEDCPVPVAFLLNESDCFEQMREAIDLGFNALMVENEGLSLDRYTELVCRVISMAHPQGVAVEAQVGHLPNGHDSNGAEITDPEVARAFVRTTGVDALGVSVGNVHILTDGTAAPNLNALARIHAAVDVPLVMHGGTGFPRQCAGDVIRLGVAKFNFGTVLKQAFLAAMKDGIESYAEPMNPHPFLGMGGSKDVMMAGRAAMAEQVKQILVSFGSAGKACQAGLANTGAGTQKERI
jgi:fructose/tagatose bisphosphate aldolase